jgi:hypothetical protein
VSVSDDDLLARVYSMTDDDDAEIQRMRELRTALRSMPDEEPPERGLAELMVAARSKAEDLKPVPWWRRIGAMLRRPSVLALASVLVLVGGAMLIGRRGDDAATPTAAPEKPAVSIRAEQTRPGEDSEREKKDKDAAKAPEPPPVTPDRPRTHAIPPARDDHPRHMPPPPPPSPPPPAHLDGRLLEHGNRPATETETTEPVDTLGETQSGTDQTRSNVNQDKAGETKHVAEPPKPDPAPETGTMAPGGLVPPAQARGPAIDQLLRQCQTAAGRGDCPAAKALAERIEKQDATFYRERVVKDAAVAKCLK